jgi:hypothetical protein
MFLIISFIRCGGKGYVLEIGHIAFGPLLKHLGAFILLLSTIMRYPYTYQLIQVAPALPLFGKPLYILNIHIEEKLFMSIYRAFEILS